jgi:hypothetical protein
MGLFDKAKDAISDRQDDIKNQASQHSDQVEQGIDKAGNTVVAALPLPSGAGPWDRLRYVVDDSEVAKLVFEGVLALVDLIGELAAGLVVDSVASLVDALLDLIAVLAGLILDVGDL